MSQSRAMTTTVEVFADITCPFTHVGLRIMRAELDKLSTPATVRVRAWPLEWVNGEPMDGTAVAGKVLNLRPQLGDAHFANFDPLSFPTTTIPALNLTASAYELDAESGLRMSLEIRDLLFEQGHDIASNDVLGPLAARYGLDTPTLEPSQSILDDYEAGQQLQVLGSPHFFVADEDFFCPSLDLQRDEAGNLKAQVDVHGIADFLSRI